ncbi:MAG: DUF1566 domain-containing protein [Bacteroidota bacterium]
MKYAVLLLALMFVGVATPSMAQKVDTTGPVPQKLTFEFEGETIEVAKKDFSNRMNWGAAKKACKNLGNGWRLPSINELEAMYEQLHREDKGNFRMGHALWYWSSSEDNEGNVWYFSFEYGSAGNAIGSGRDKSQTEYVRAVRTLP